MDKISLKSEFYVILHFTITPEHNMLTFYDFSKNEFVSKVAVYVGSENVGTKNLRALKITSWKYRITLHCSLEFFKTLRAEISEKLELFINCLELSKMLNGFVKKTCFWVYSLIFTSSYFTHPSWWLSTQSCKIWNLQWAAVYLQFSIRQKQLFFSWE